MRGLIFIFIALSVLLSSSCTSHESTDTDARLEVAEELLSAYPDSALALLTSISIDSIENKSDYAHYSLLMTQAKWETDALEDEGGLLDFALEYYGDNHDPGKLTRSLVYKALILERAGNEPAALRYYIQAQENCDTAVSHDASMEMHRMRCISIVDREMAKVKDKSKSKDRQLLVLKIVFFLSIIVLMGKIVRMRLTARQNIILINRLRADSDNVKSQLIEKLEHETKLKNVLSSQIANIRDLIDLSYRLGGNPSAFMKRFHERVKITKLPDDFWKDLRFFVDCNYNNVITRLEKIYPNLTEDELYLIGLMCCGFSYTEIAICMGYTNVGSANTKRARIMKKMGLSEPLKDYIDRLIAQDGN